MVQSFHGGYCCLILLGGAGLGWLCYWGAHVCIKQEKELNGAAAGKLLNCRFMQLASILLLFSLLLRFHWSWQLGKFMVLGCLLLAIGLIDYYSFLIPDSLLRLGLLLYVPISLLDGQSVLELLWQGLVGGCAVALPLMLFYFGCRCVVAEGNHGWRRYQIIFSAGRLYGAVLDLFDLVSVLSGRLTLAALAAILTAGRVASLWAVYWGCRLAGAFVGRADAGLVPAIFAVKRCGNRKIKSLSACFCV